MAIKEESVSYRDTPYLWPADGVYCLGPVYNPSTTRPLFQEFMQIILDK